MILLICAAIGLITIIWLNSASLACTPILLLSEFIYALYIPPLGSFGIAARYIGTNTLRSALPVQSVEPPTCSVPVSHISCFDAVIPIGLGFIIY